MLAVLFWSGNFIAGRAIAGSIPPLELNIIRWAICLAILLTFTSRKLFRHRSSLLASWRLVLLLGVTGIGAFHTMVYQALTLTTAVNCLLILAMAPVVTVIGGALLSGFRPTVFQLAGLLLSVTGAVYLAINAGDGHDHGIDMGKLWMIGAILVWAWYTLLLREKPVDLPSDVLLAASVITGLCLMLDVLLLKGPAHVELTPANMLAIIHIAVFASLLGFLFWSHGIAVIGPERGGQFVHLMPVFWKRHGRCVPRRAADNRSHDRGSIHRHRPRTGQPADAAINSATSS